MGEVAGCWQVPTKIIQVEVQVKILLQHLALAGCSRGQAGQILARLSSRFENQIVVAAPDQIAVVAGFVSGKSCASKPLRVKSIKRKSPVPAYLLHIRFAGYPVAESVTLKVRPACATAPAQGSSHNRGKALHFMAAICDSEAAPW